jgi:hypothetical protein
LGDALANAGRGAQAAEAYLRAAEGAEPAEARKLQRMAAQQYLRSGRLSAGLPLTAELLNQVGISFPRSQTATLSRLLVEHAKLAFTPIRKAGERSRKAPAASLERLETLSAVFKEVMPIDPLLGTLLQTRLLREAASAGQPNHIMQALAWVATSVALNSGELKRAKVLAMIEQAEGLAKELGEPYGFATVAAARSAAAHCSADFGIVERLALAAETTFRTQCPGSSWEVTFVRAWRYAAIELGGNLATFAREAPDCERDAREKGDDYAIGFLTIVSPLVHMMRDDGDDAIAHLKDQEARLSDSFDTFHLWVMLRTGDAHLYVGDPARASSYLAQSWPAFQSSLLSRGRLLQVNANFLRGRVAIANLRVSDNAAAERDARQAIRQLKACKRPDALAYAHLLSAGLSHAHGDGERAASELRAAITLCESAGMNNFGIYARRNLGTLLGGTDGQALVGQADAALTAMGVQHPKRWVATYAPGF